MKEFKTSSTWIVMYAASGLVFIVLGLLMPRYFYIGIGALICVVSAYLAMVPIVRLREDHFEMKVAPAAPKKLVLYREIERLEEVKPKKVFLHTKVDGKPKKIRLPLSQLAPPDRATLLAELNARAFA